MDGELIEPPARDRTPSPGRATGATLKEIMSRIGHASTRAAMIYQHARSKRDHEIAVALDALIRAAREAAQEDEETSNR